MIKSKRQTALVEEMIRERDKDIAALQKLLSDLKWDPHPRISKTAEKSIEERGEDVRRAIREDPEGFKNHIRDLDGTNSLEALKRENHSSFYGLDAYNPDKPCRAMREGTPLCGDLPGMAPRGKCYFDHQKDCNAWCSAWEGDEDNDDVMNIREIQGFEERKVHKASLFDEEGFVSFCKRWNKDK